MNTDLISEPKIYTCKIKINGKEYFQKKYYQPTIKKIPFWILNNQIKYNEFLNNKDKYNSIQNKSYYLQSLTNLSFSCCRKYIIDNNL